MRGLVDGLVSPVPLADTLPALLREDPFARGLCSGLDEVVAPVLLSLDTFPAYLDLALAPEDVLGWLAHWVGMAIDPGQDIDRQRRLLQSSDELHLLRGTRRGIELAIEAALGVWVDITETGASTWSSDPTAELPGESIPAIVVTARPRAGREIDLERLDALVGALKPAHVQHRIQLAGAD